VKLIAYPWSVPTKSTAIINTNEVIDQLLDVSAGVQYLHSVNFVHGGLKGVRKHIQARRRALA
jgi:hypothetical protein